MRTESIQKIKLCDLDESAHLLYCMQYFSGAEMEGTNQEINNRNMKQSVYRQIMNSSLIKKYRPYLLICQDEMDIYLFQDFPKIFLFLSEMHLQEKRDQAASFLILSFLFGSHGNADRVERLCKKVSESSLMLSCQWTHTSVLLSPLTFIIVIFNLHILFKLEYK